MQNTQDWYKKLDAGENRLRDMEENGIEMQVLSLASAIERFEPAEAIIQAKNTNDALSGLVKKYPDLGYL